MKKTAKPTCKFSEDTTFEATLYGRQMQRRYDVVLTLFVPWHWSGSVIKTSKKPSYVPIF